MKFSTSQNNFNGAWHQRAPKPSTICAEMASRIERWPIERLVPYERNARTHSPQQIRKIADSIREFGFTNPILVDDKAGIIAGHARLSAARDLNLPEVPVIVLSHLSEAQKRAYILADNRLAMEAGWDDEILREELEALVSDGFDLDLTGFTHDELESYLDEDSSSDREDESACGRNDRRYAARRSMAPRSPSHSVWRCPGTESLGCTDGRRTRRHGLHGSTVWRGIPSGSQTGRRRAPSHRK